MSTPNKSKAQWHLGEANSYRARAARLEAEGDFGGMTKLRGEADFHAFQAKQLLSSEVPVPCRTETD